MILYHRHSFLNCTHHTVSFAAARLKNTWFMQIVQKKLKKKTILETEVWETFKKWGHPPKQFRFHLAVQPSDWQVGRWCFGQTLFYMKGLLHIAALSLTPWCVGTPNTPNNYFSITLSPTHSKVKSTSCPPQPFLPWKALDFPPSGATPLPLQRPPSTSSWLEAAFQSVHATCWGTFSSLLQSLPDKVLV